MLSEPETVVPARGDALLHDKVKTYLRIDGTDLDFELTLMRQAAQDDLERITGLRLLNQVVRVRADSVQDLAHLTVGPARSLVAIGTVSTSGDLDPVDIAGFELTGVGLARGIRPIGAVPAAFARRPIYADVKVGYADDGDKIPATLRLALFTLIRGRFEERPVEIEWLIHDFRINP
ncbi:hypothetical protein GCM10022268_17270 [Sphingomonas cynarae]|uniref:Uncharacterized protein n=1 Tax=Sphingomonas cynarae TaxID=930197 RepID=A0ABP7DT02_9SPHN